MGQDATVALKQEDGSSGLSQWGSKQYQTDPVICRGGRGLLVEHIDRALFQFGSYGEVIVSQCVFARLFKCKSCGLIFSTL